MQTLAEGLRLPTNGLDYTILAIYFAVVLGIGFAARASVRTSLDFFLSGRSLPAWVTGLAFVAANLGATEILGMAANGAQYGAYTVHWYWIGAIPAMVFLGLVMMPFYYGSKVRSVPEFLLHRFGPSSHLLSSIIFAVSSVLIAGVNLYAMAIVLEALLGWPEWVAIVVIGFFVLAYITIGGLSSAIYNEVLQFFVILAALIPLTVVGLKRVGGWGGLTDSLTGSHGGEFLTAWEGTGVGSANPLGANWLTIVLGLGFVMSFGYWTTNFAEVQRALSAKNLSAAKRTPLIAAFPKIFIPMVVIVPGLIALVMELPGQGGQRPPVQRRDPGPHARPAAERCAGHRRDRPAGRLHGRYGGQRLLVQHRVHERHLGRVPQEGPRGRVLPEDRTGRHGGRCADRHGDGVHRVQLQQHHELPPDAVLVLQRPAVRRLHHRHVLEADHMRPASYRACSPAPPPR